MKFSRLSLITLGSISLLFLGACSSSNPTTKAEVKSEATSKDSGKYKHSSQVVQSEKYHVDLKPDLDKDSIHLDTVVHDGQDKPITTAKLTAQIQLPDGTSKTLPVAYNAEEKQYTGKLAASKAAGDYKVVIQADVNGDKFNSRFSFKK
jgi:hypothetical protein